MKDLNQNNSMQANNQNSLIAEENRILIKEFQTQIHIIKNVLGQLAASDEDFFRKLESKLLSEQRVIQKNDRHSINAKTVNPFNNEDENQEILSLESQDSMTQNYSNSALLAVPILPHQVKSNSQMEMESQTQQQADGFTTPTPVKRPPPPFPPAKVFEGISLLSDFRKDLRKEVCMETAKYLILLNYREGNKFHCMDKAQLIEEEARIKLPDVKKYQNFYKLFIPATIARAVRNLRNYY